MGFFDLLLGFIILDSLSDRKERSQSDNYGSTSYDRGYGDSYDDAWHDREFDNECDCGYCSDHDDGW